MSELVDELLSRVQADQKMRNDALADRIEWDETVDRDNTEYLRKLVETHGWPMQSDVGTDASQAAWLLIQHGDHDSAFQAHCLSLMKALPANEVSSAHVAYLEDRVCVNQGQPQLYGTQFYQEGDFFGPRPIDDVENLEARRKAAGLEPFSDYEARMQEIQKNRSSK
jgi:hypothetical protein